MRVRTCVATLVLLGVAACGQGEPTSTKPTFGGGPGSTASSSDLSAAKKAAGIRDCPSSTGETPRDDALPDLTLECLGGGQPVRLAGLGGTPTVINLWASWCGPCREELPLLARADRAYGDNLRVLGVDFADSAPDAAIELARRSGVTYPLLADPDEKTKVPLKVIGLPQTVFVDAQGTIVATERIAYRSYADLTAAIDRHLGVSP